jgi:hypothetical protein
MQKLTDWVESEKCPIWKLQADILSHANEVHIPTKNIQHWIEYGPCMPGASAPVKSVFTNKMTMAAQEHPSECFHASFSIENYS